MECLGWPTGRSVMGGSGRWEVKVHEHGLVALLDVMPRFAPVGKTADFAIVQAARVTSSTICGLLTSPCWWRA